MYYTHAHTLTRTNLDIEEEGDFPHLEKLVLLMIFAMFSDQIVITDLGKGETVNAFSNLGWWTQVTEMMFDVWF